MNEADYRLRYGQLGSVVADVQRETVRWLWPGRLAFGKLAILDGDPGTGKSTLICDIIGRYTSGRKLYGADVVLETGNAVIVTGEDGISDTIRPRLEEAGADLSRVTVLQTFLDFDEKSKTKIERVPVLPDDADVIAELVRERRARLLIIDPLMAHLSSGVNAFKDQDVRRALTPLARLADELGIAVVILRHLNKMPGGSALYRGGGSIGIIGAARTALLLGKDPNDDDSLVLASTKSNLGKLGRSLSLRIVPSSRDSNVGIIQWRRESKYSASDLLTQPRKRDSPELDRAKEWLTSHLADGDPKPARGMWERAEADGLNEKSVRRALKVLKIEIERIGGIAGKGAWYWSLPLPKADIINDNSLHLSGEYSSFHSEKSILDISRSPNQDVKDHLTDADANTSSTTSVNQ